MRWMKIGVLALVCVAGLAFAACGDDDDETIDGNGGTTAPATETDGATESPTETVTSTPDQTDATPGETDGAEIRVAAEDFFFDPNSIQVSAGAVAFEVENEGGAPHTMTIYRDEGYTDAVDGGDTGTLDGGEDATITNTFDEAGTFYFRCEIHPFQMEGTITVQ